MHNATLKLFHAYVKSIDNLHDKHPLSPTTFPVADLGFWKGGFQCAQDWWHKAHEVRLQGVCGMWGHVPPGFQTFWDRFGLKQQDLELDDQLPNLVIVFEAKLNARTI